MLITTLKPNEIFVFGSNLSGRHGAGAALYARKYFGAHYGVPEGLQGQSYAIPTKDRQINTLPISEISKYIVTFLQFASDNPQLRFLLTEIGCGLAEYTPKEIAPLFANHTENVIFPESFLSALNS